MTPTSLFSRNLILCASLFLLAVQTMLFYWIILRSRRRRRARRTGRKKYPSHVKPYEITTDDSQNLNESTDMGYIASKAMNILESTRMYMDPKLRLDELSKKVGTNRNYLSRAINDCFMINFSKLCNYFRVKEACGLYLSNPKISRDIWVEKSGFSSFSSFSHAFETFTDYSPAKWQKEVHRRIKRKETVSVSDYLKELRAI